MEKILINQINSKYDLINSLYEIKNKSYSKYKFRLIIIDSLPPLLYQDKDKSNTYGHLNHIVNIIRFLSTEYHMVFIITNIVTQWFDGDFETKVSHIDKFGCGKYWNKIPNTKLRIDTDGYKNKVSVVKSCNLPIGRSCFVKITDNGMVDV